LAAPLTADRLVAALKAEGVRVVEHAGWRTHNRNSAGPWGGINGVLIHHTAGSNSLGIVYSGRSDLPGPLAHTHLAKTGVATMVGNGRANHAGKAARNAFDAIVAESSTHPRPSAASGTVDGNAHLYGIEIENLGNGKDPYPAVQYDAAVRWAAAICRAHGWGANSVAGHKETSVEGKIDPSFDMNAFRAKVDERLKHPASWNPSTTIPEEDPLAGLSKQDIHDAVWRIDDLQAPADAPDLKTNPTWQPQSILRDIQAIVRANKATEAAQTAAIAKLASLIGTSVDTATVVAAVQKAIADAVVKVSIDVTGQPDS
jgi:hypothetical protein